MILMAHGIRSSLPTSHQQQNVFSAASCESPCYLSGHARTLCIGHPCRAAVLAARLPVVWRGLILLCVMELKVSTDTSYTFAGPHQPRGDPGEGRPRIRAHILVLARRQQRPTALLPRWCEFVSRPCTCTACPLDWQQEPALVSFCNLGPAVA